jgi:hypothetical protein
MHDASRLWSVEVCGPGLGHGASGGSGGASGGGGAGGGGGVGAWPGGCGGNGGGCKPHAQAWIAAQRFEYAEARAEHVVMELSVVRLIEQPYELSSLPQGQIEAVLDA